MKPKKLSKKLFLNKKTVADLGKKEMKEINGGIKWTYPISKCLSYMCC